MRLAVCLSGRGSNFAALLAHRADLPEIALVLADQIDAPGLKIAQEAGIKTVVCPRKKGQSKVAHEGAMQAALHGIDALILAGFMRILSADFIARFQAVVNIHPSLLPAYPGLDTHARALAAGETQHGCTVHLVDAGVDTGPILAQACLTIGPGETPQALAARVLELEHRLYGPTLIKFFNSHNSLLAEGGQSA